MANELNFLLNLLDFLHFKHFTWVEVMVVVEVDQDRFIRGYQQGRRPILERASN